MQEHYHSYMRNFCFWKIQACGDSNHDLCDAGAALQPIELTRQLGDGQYIGCS